MPVVFVTAFPERLLTGLKSEPTYLIRKPFRVQEIRAAVSQALFFALQSSREPVAIEDNTQKVAV